MTIKDRFFINLDLERRAEKAALPKLQEYLKAPLEKLGTSSVFDYRDGDHQAFVELKSRRCESFRHPDTVINLSKLEYADKTLVGKCVFFAFFFHADKKAFLVEYTKQRFSSFKISENNGKKLVHIPFSELTEL